MLLVSLALFPSCRQSASRRLEGPTQTDRLMQAYSELHGGRRFVVIADFENPTHMELIQSISVSDGASCVLDRRSGRPETGRACLRFTTGSPDDTVIINNAAAKNWYLKRDWRDYDLLLMNIKSPQKDLRVEVEVAAGAPAQQLGVQSSIALEEGWNVVRLDLAEVGERIPLDDVREMRLSIAGQNEAVDVLLDDLILTGNREDLLGNSQSTDGSLYVQRAGRRWNIGAGGRFELTFANGQIVRWHNLEQDPYRLRNLVEGTTLGPSPMLLGASEDGEDDFSRLGEMVVAHTRITEMNPVRTVVTCEWRFLNDVDEPAHDKPFQRWIYTVYPTGQVFVAVECTAKAEGWSASRIALAVTLSTKTGDGVRTHSSPPSAASPAYATARIESADALLLYVLSEPHELMPMRGQVNKDHRRVSLVASRPASGSDVENWLCALTLGSASATSEAEASSRALDYSSPGGLHLELGSFAAANGMNIQKDGFDQASGCHVITPDQGRARFVIDGRDRARFSPAFKITEAKDREAWVYVNHLIFKNVARDVDGNLIFQLPDTITDRATVEVLFRRPQRFDAA